MKRGEGRGDKLRVGTSEAVGASGPHFGKVVRRARRRVREFDSVGERGGGMQIGACETGEAFLRDDDCGWEEGFLGMDLGILINVHMGLEGEQKGGVGTLEVN